ncbi:methylmalonyl-CoA mutase [Babesia caballi]|uniref:Methylmalonyl-CoA mutase n=1 Tax=Babesia caballi TaxID=5871 RepID=A0AAV4LWF8_BABCB|nr:methylmalonyl-CoA mutase [Babesia caballi]
MIAFNLIVLAFCHLFACNIFAVEASSSVRTLKDEFVEFYYALEGQESDGGVYSLVVKKFNDVGLTGRATLARHELLHVKLDIDFHGDDVFKKFEVSEVKKTCQLNPEERFVLLAELTNSMVKKADALYAYMESIGGTGNVAENGSNTATGTAGESNSEGSNSPQTPPGPKTGSTAGTHDVEALKDKLLDLKFAANKSDLESSLVHLDVQIFLDDMFGKGSHIRNLKQYFDEYAEAVKSRPSATQDSMASPVTVPPESDTSGASVQPKNRSSTTFNSVATLILCIVAFSAI